MSIPVSVVLGSDATGWADELEPDLCNDVLHLILDTHTHRSTTMQCVPALSWCDPYYCPDPLLQIILNYTLLPQILHTVERPNNDHIRYICTIEVVLSLEVKMQWYA